jgi:hypothetical protein
MHMQSLTTRSLEGAGELVLRIRGEFMEMPGLRLTLAQAQKMWALDVTTCAALLARLVDAGFLYQTRDKAFMRLDRSTTPRPLLHSPGEAATGA